MFARTPFVSMQDYVNLLYREEEREMLPLCQAEGIGVIPWSPLARGRLTRDWDDKMARSETDEFGKTLYVATADADRKVVERVAAVAAQRGVPRAKSRWLGYSRSRLSPRRSSERQSRSILQTPSRRFRST